MYITTLFANTYSQDKPITGHIDVAVDGSTVHIDFNREECAELQAIAVRAYNRRREELARAILADEPAVRMLAPPEQEGEYADFTEVEIANRADDQDIPF